jgi:hypothetical protein
MAVLGPLKTLVFRYFTPLVCGSQQKEIVRKCLEQKLAGQELDFESARPDKGFR